MTASSQGWGTGPSPSVHIVHWIVIRVSLLPYDVLKAIYGCHWTTTNFLFAWKNWCLYKPASSYAPHRAMTKLLICDKANLTFLLHYKETIQKSLQQSLHRNRLSSSKEIISIWPSTRRWWTGWERSSLAAGQSKWVTYPDSNTWRLL